MPANTYSASGVAVSQLRQHSEHRLRQRDPIGSPGMEVDGMKPTAYRVLTFDKSGTTRTFSTYDRIKE